LRSIANIQTLSSFLYHSLITITVGAEKAVFSVHKELLCDRSEFFRAACNGQFKEAEGVVNLPEQDPTTFKHFIYWLYTEKLRGHFYPESIDPSIQDLKRELKSTLGPEALNDRHLKRKNPDSEALDHANYQDLPFVALVSLYILADSLLVRGLRDQIIPLLIEVYGYSYFVSRPKGVVLRFWRRLDSPRRPAGLPSPAVGINLAWERTSKDSQLRQVLLKLFCDNVDHKISSEEPYNAEFLLEAVRVVLYRWVENAGTTDWATKGAICDHHIHDVKCPLQYDVGEESEEG